jgi:large subunit ribosomal protein L32
MAVPKRKVSKARKNKRRSNVWKIAVPGFCKCPQCGELKLRCSLQELRILQGKEIVKVEEEAEPPIEIAFRKSRGGQTCLSGLFFCPGLLQFFPPHV